METFKYAAVWQRARMKLKTRKALESLRADLNLYGGTKEVAVLQTPHPRKGTPVWWEAVIHLAILYGAIVLPLRTVFGDPASSWIYSDLGLSLLFLCDFIISLRRRKWIPSLLDAIACVPSVFQAWLQLTKLYRLLALARIVKFSLRPSEHELSVRLKNYLHLNQTQLQLLLSLLAIFTCIHVTTCLFYLTAQLDGMSPETWVVRSRQEDKSLASLYLAGLYWSVTTFATVGYGDLACRTVKERVLGICWMICSVYFFSFTLSSLTSLFMSVETKQNVLLDKLSLLNEFAKEAKLSRKITRKLNEAIRYSSSQSGFSWSSNQELFQELPKKLRYEVALAMHKGAAKSLPFFSEHPRDFLAAIVPFLQDIRKHPGDLILHEQDYADEIYFLPHGRVNYTLHRFVYKILHESCYFGDIEVLRQIPRKYTLVAATECNLLVMRKEALGVIRSAFPMIWEEMMEVALAREEMIDKARDEAQAYLTILKAGQMSLQPDQLRAQLAELKQQEEPNLEELNERLQFCQTRCENLKTGMQQVRVNVQVLKQLLVH